jgi:alkane 1-monooxygenase
MLLHLLLPLGFTLSPLVGWLLGWHWLTVVLATLVLPLAEWTVGREPADAPSTDYRWPTWFLRAVMLAVLMICTGFALLAPYMTGSELIPMALGCGYVAGGIGIVLAHELGHRRPAIDRALARTLLCGIAYGHYAIEHNRGHHRAASTRSDAATARREESLWRFMPRYFFYVFIDAVKLSRAKRGLTNEAIALASITLLMASLLFVAGGWRSCLFAIITGATAQFLVAAIDYAEHWGLERRTIDGKPERMGPQHTWDCANRVSDALLFNLPRHSAHHLEPSLDCNDLIRMPASPQMPTGYAGMTILAALWPLYRWIMTPRLPDAQTGHAIVAASSSHLASGEFR